MKFKKNLLLFCIIAFLAPTIFAAQQSVKPYQPWQINIGYSNGNVAEFDNSSGNTEYRVAGMLFPKSWHYKFIYGGLDLAFAYFHNSDSQLSHRNLQAYSFGPVVQFRFFRDSFVSPYIEGGVSPTYISSVYFADRKLGIHFLFQDFGGVGVRLQSHYPVNLGVRMMHYSNASLSKHNRGITMPVFFYVGISF